jgi:uncharacterized protein YjdB
LGADLTTPAEGVANDYQAVNWSVLELDGVTPSLDVQVTGTASPYTVKGLTVGKAIITATSPGFAGATSDTCPVDVTAAPVLPVTVEIDHSPYDTIITTLYIDRGTTGATASTGTLAARVLGDDGAGGKPAATNPPSGPAVTWSAVDVTGSNVITVDADGIYTAHSSGTATITATSAVENASGSKVDSAPVTVTVVVLPHYIELSTYNLTTPNMTSNTTGSITATVWGYEAVNGHGDALPADADKSDVTWHSAPDDSIITFDDPTVGTWRAVSPGTTATIFAKSAYPGTPTLVSDPCDVTVSAGHVDVTGVSVTPLTLKLAPGQSKTVTAVLAPNTAEMGAGMATWDSSSPSHATVMKATDTTATVTGVAVGSADITVEVDDSAEGTGTFDNELAPCVVTVEIKPDTVAINNPGSSNMAALKYPETGTLTATVFNEDDFDITSLLNAADFTWEASPTGVINFPSSTSGYFETVGSSTVNGANTPVTIKVTHTPSGKYKELNGVNVTVDPFVIDIESTPSSLANLDLGATGTLQWKVYGDAGKSVPATVQDVNWVSSYPSSTTGVTVNNDGDYEVIGKPPSGTVTFTATSTENSTTEFCTATVFVKGWGVKINGTNHEVTQDTSDLTMTASVVGKDATTPADTPAAWTLLWSDSDLMSTGVIVIDPDTGVVTADGDTTAGDTVEITVTLVGGAALAPASDGPVTVTVAAP